MLLLSTIFSHVHATLYPAMSVGPFVCRMVTLGFFSVYRRVNHCCAYPNARLAFFITAAATRTRVYTIRPCSFTEQPNEWAIKELMNSSYVAVKALKMNFMHVTWRNHSQIVKWKETQKLPLICASFLKRRLWTLSLQTCIQIHQTIPLFG